MNLHIARVARPNYFIYPDEAIFKIPAKLFYTLISLQEWKSAAVESLNTLFEKVEAERLVRFLCEDLSVTANNWSENLHRIADSALTKLIEGQPLAYVTRKAWFYGLELKVSPAVLIPRPETEELVELIIQNTAPFNKPIQALDIGTGSGCIALALKKHIPIANMTGVDKSSAALEIASINAKQLGLDIKWELCDFLNPLRRDSLKGSWDIIVSNPPYIPMSEVEQMGESVVKFEPHMALFTNDQDGMEFYRAIALFGMERLTPNGHVYLELNEFRAAETATIFTQHGFQTEIIHDLSGKKRMLKASF